MEKTCQQCHASFVITPHEQELYIKFDAPESEVCFECDQKWRISFRNDRNLFKDTCDDTGKAILSVYSPESPYIVYSSESWYGDSWDGLEYGMDFDFSRTFTEQFAELQLKVPRLNMINVRAENSEYCNMSMGNKNCYLIFGGDFNEDCQYGALGMHNKDVIDADYSNDNQLCYMLGDSINCYGSSYLFDSSNCRNSAFLSDCIGCSDCILCTNLVNQQYCINNQQLTKEAYMAEKERLLNGGHQQMQQNWNDFLALRKQRVVKNAHHMNSQNCSGDYIKNSKNCQRCFDTSDSEDLCNIIFAAKAKDCFHCSLLGDNAELAFQAWGVLGSTDVQYAHFIINCSNIRYSEMCIGSHNLFGCNGLRQKKNCILNKQYSPEAFEELKEKIIAHMKTTGEWGKYFDKSLSCYGYNESTANEYFPLSEEQALAEGFKWSKPYEEPLNVEKIIPADKLPDHISDVPDDMLNWAIACQKTGKGFRITSKELQFYRQQNLPLPRLHPEERHKLRMSIRNERRLYNGNCESCRKDIQTSYPPGSSEKILCEDCYRKEVF